ncbi:hypothetical protein APHAL10511_007819 [Amanita phalloides]|nr:hypothetical protein APHAL10511_007819 [Amanita phalloides]
MPDVEKQLSADSPREALQDTFNRWPSQKASKPRTRSAKYLLRQGSIHVENWNCDLSEMYSRKSPRSLSPSPLMPGSSEQTYRFASESPDLPAHMPFGIASSHSLRSPFLSSVSVQHLEKPRDSPILAAADVSDITQLVMQDFQPIAYSNNPSSAATTCTLWDVPATQPGSLALPQDNDSLLHVLDPYPYDIMYVLSLPRRAYLSSEEGHEALSIGPAVSPL